MMLQIKNILIFILFCVGLPSRIIKTLIDQSSKLTTSRAFYNDKLGIICILQNYSIIRKFYNFR